MGQGRNPKSLVSIPSRKLLSDAHIFSELYISEFSFHCPLAILIAIFTPHYNQLHRKHFFFIVVIKCMNIENESINQKDSEIKVKVK